MTPTLRRLNDRERYWGLTWPGWAAAGGAGGALYGAIKLSPFAIKPTITIAALLLATIIVLTLGVCGQSLSPGRQLMAIIAYRRRPKRWTLRDSDTPAGLVLSTAPDLATVTAGRDGTLTPGEPDGLVDLVAESTP